MQTITRSFTSNVHRQSHRPSIFGWALSNEIAFTRAGKGGNSGLVNNMFASMYLVSKAFDPERPVWFSDGADFSMPSAEALANLKCRADNVQPGDNTSCTAGSECLYQRCFQDVLVLQAGWSHVEAWYGVDQGPYHALAGQVRQSSVLRVHSGHPRFHHFREFSLKNAST